MPESAISLIIPTYNVAEFIEPCLASLKAQTFTNFDVVVVNDGSTDDSADRARRFVAGDDRFTVVDQANSGPGPGGGRNGGLAHTRSERLMFLDSDDALLSDALEKLVAAFHAVPDLDIASTSAARLFGAQVRPSHFHDISHPCAESSTTAAASPWLMFDSTPWNKAFRRAFFDRTVGAWPAQQLYEDIAPMTAALLDATAIAVLTERHYLWRLRGEGSITHTQSTIAGDLAQLDQLSIARESVIAAASPALLRWFDWKTLTQDLLWMTRKLIAVSSENSHALHQAVRTMLLEIDPALVQATEPALRQCYDSMLTRSPNQTTRRVGRWRYALLQDRRSPDHAVESPSQLVSLRRMRREPQSITVTVSSNTMHLRDASLQVHDKPPWHPGTRTPVASFKPSRSFGAMATFTIHADLLSESGADAALTRSYYIDVASKSGEVVEITRSLLDAAKRRVIDAGQTKPCSLTTFYDDGRLRLLVGALTPTITDATMADGFIELSGEWPEGVTPASDAQLSLTQSRSGAPVHAIDIETAGRSFRAAVPPEAVKALSIVNTWVSLTAASNPAVPRPFGVGSALLVKRPGLPSIRVQPGPFGEATLLLATTPGTRGRALVNEALTYVPTDVKGTQRIKPEDD